IALAGAVERDRLAIDELDAPQTAVCAVHNKQRAARRASRMHVAGDGAPGAANVTIGPPPNAAPYSRRSLVQSKTKPLPDHQPSKFDLIINPLKAEAGGMWTLCSRRSGITRYSGCWLLCRWH